MTDRFVTVPDSLELPAAVKVPSARLSDSGATGRAALAAADAAALRAAAELGSAATTAATDYATAAQGAAARRTTLRLTRSGQTTRRPLFTIIDDDGSAGVITALAPILTARGIPGGVAAIGNTSQVFTSPEYRAQLKTLQDDHGWEILSHTMNHINVNTVDPDTYDTECAEFISLAASYGFNVDNLVYPWGNTGGNTHVAPRYFTGGFGTGTGYNIFGRVNSYNVNRQGLGSMMSAGLNTLPGFQAIIDRTIANSEWLVFMTHIGATDETGIQLIKDVLDYVQAQGGVFVTPRDGLAEFGALIASGYRQAEYFHLLPAGIVDSSRYLMPEVRPMNWKSEADGPEAPSAPRQITWQVSGWSIGNGTVTEHVGSDGWGVQEFRSTTRERYTRGATGSAWRAWVRQLLGLPLQFTVPARTVAAHSTLSYTLPWPSLQTVWPISVAPKGGLMEEGVIWAAQCTVPGQLLLRFGNVTDTEVVLAERVWNAVAIGTP